MSPTAPGRPRLLNILVGLSLLSGLSIVTPETTQAASSTSLDQPAPALSDPARPDVDVVTILGEVAWAQSARVSRGAVARGPRGGVVARGRSTVVRGGRRPVAMGPGRRAGVVAPGRRSVVVAPGWRRPASYYWRPGGAIAAGAAIGFVGAAAAAAYAGSPPAPGYCWYYTDPQRTQGFWDICPR